MLNNIFGKKPTVKEQQRENDKSLRKASRDVERELAKLEQEETKLKLEIKKNAKLSNKGACDILAKQLIQVRKQKNRIYAANSKISAVGFQNKTMGANIAISGAMGTTAKIMGEMNAITKPEQISKTMQDFERANMKMGMTDEMINDTLDDLLTESGDEEEQNDIINKVLDEIGIEVSGKMSNIPTAVGNEIGESARTDKSIEEQLAKLKAI